MKRTHYGNGDEITLSCGCDGCNPFMINGVLCHETGCPESWRDYMAECSECGCDVFPRHANPGRHYVCDECSADLSDLDHGDE